MSANTAEITILLFIWGNPNSLTPKTCYCARHLVSNIHEQHVPSRTCHNHLGSPVTPGNFKSLAELELTHELEPRLPNAEAEWTVINNELPNLDFDDFANVDEGVSVYGSLSDQDIIATVTSEDVLSDDDNDDGMEQPPDITTKEAKAAVNTLRSYLEQSSDVPDNVFSAVVVIENIIDLNSEKSLRQTKITDYFQI
ncbi:hypothetical protein J6590_074554 [Homalodisca vitripennis]|nr:hypothetical protein J6590_074554 [Homalodisca vitripennis]